MEVQSKPWYESVTTWGIVITILSAILSAFGISVGPDTQQAAIDIVPKAVEAIKTKDWIEFISIAVGFVGVVITTVGRTQAAQPIHFMSPFKVKVDHLVEKAPEGSTAKLAA
jgi:Na+(H+)/acetate symporter ActP